MPSTCLALLRGINVGGKNKLLMADLKAVFTAAGCENVQTFIQSGNVLFDAPAPILAGLEQRITAQIAAQFGLRVPVIMRTQEQVREVIRNNPFLAAGAAEDTLHVLFLADLPSPDRVSCLDPDRSPPDTFCVRGREIYLYLPRGVADTKLSSAYFDSKLATVTTSRNWRTVTTLLARMAGEDTGKIPGER